MTYIEWIPAVNLASIRQILPRQTVFHQMMMNQATFHLYTYGQEQVSSQLFFRFIRKFAPPTLEKRRKERQSIDTVCGHISKNVTDI